MWWVPLAVISAGVTFKRARLGIPFLASLLMVVFVDSLNPYYEVQYFIAIYGGIGALLYLSGEHLSGAFLCAIGTLHGLQLFGSIELHTRQVIGELTFVLGLVAGYFLGPPVPRSDRHSVLVRRFGFSPNSGHVSGRVLGEKGGIAS